MNIKEWWDKNITKLILGKIGKNIVEEGPIEKTITLGDIQKLVSNISGSSDAVERVMQVLDTKEVKIEEKVKVDASTWRAYILYTPIGGYLVTYKKNWLWNYGNLFNRPEKQGTGLNLHLAKYCQLNGVDTLLIVKGDGTIYSMDINDLMNYATTHNTIRQEKESFEAHVPTTLLKLFTIKNEKNK